MPSPGLPITMLLQRLMATTLHLPKPLSAAMDHLTAGLLCIKSETSALILGMESMLRRVGGNMETSTTSCGLGIKLIALASFLVTTTLAARVFEICRNPAILFLRTKRTFLYIPAYFATLQNALSNMS